jgi:lipoic acid synthetase
MSDTDRYVSPSRLDPQGHRRAADKIRTIPVRVEGEQPARPARKPSWIRAKAQVHPRVRSIKRILREKNLHSVCEEAACPNLGECFAKGTATFMILGDICTRRCRFCDVATGRPNAPDPEEPRHLAETVEALGLDYVVITSVDRDDLEDRGATQFAECIREIRARVPGTRIEILTPDFRNRIEAALDILDEALPDVFNHNVETVPRLYRTARPASSYEGSLALLHAFRERHPGIPTKSGLMVGLGEEIAEVEDVMRDLRAHACTMLTIGQYLQPSPAHLPVARYVHPDEFDRLRDVGYELGFDHVASGPMVRSSYHADEQAAGVLDAAGT